MTAISRRIREQRERAGWSPSELAAASGIAQPNISAYESAQLTPGPETVDRLFAAMRLVDRSIIWGVLATRLPEFRRITGI